MPQAAGEGAARVGDRFHLDPVDWYRRAEPPLHLPAIARAVWGQRRLVIRYESWSATVRRTVDPLGLVLKAGTWYLMARIGTGVRTYKVAKVLDLDVLPDGFDYPAGFDLAVQWQESLQRFARELRRAEATLLVSPEALPLLDRLGADAVEAVQRAQPDAEGWRRATVPIEGVGHAARLLLGFTDAIEVLDPPELRRALAEGARRVMQLYDKEH
ncbi:YafY family protein [Mycobacterium sp. KBS0706]|uniref:helix-turn-helix transcriptional regulator n=1 Tax=Mycobacterium sp. KBS0706 TaxID=2578109 RepID=UPI001C8F9BFC|nr:WYL domain-containing protein [Mycobacterium sp. KBS0706]